MKMSTSIPWPAKMIGKLVLSRVPAPYRCWHRLGIFRHGDMRDPSYAYSKFMAHYSRVAFSRKGLGFVALELGPGDSLHSALIARSVGASRTYLVDVGRYAPCPADCCRSMVEYLCRQAAEGGGVDGNLAIEDCVSEYRTRGLESLKEIPDGSVDFVWSEAVLEHIRLNELAQVMRQLRRILRRDGVCSHHVDLKDHLGGSLNHLRFSDSVWESALFRDSGFYTNRVRLSEMLRLFREAGFCVESVETVRWPELPVRRSVLDDHFASMPDSELCVSGFDVVLRRVS